MRFRTAILAIFSAFPSAAQVDQERAAAYFKEAAALCEKEGGKLWGVSLCGPMVFADAATKTIATSEPAPSARRPPALGFANTALEWGGIRWSTYMWRMVPEDKGHRGRMLIHELFHRVQPQLGFMTPDGQNEHMDTLDGRYWMQLEWRALAKALSSTGKGRDAAISDAFAFRQKRRELFPNAAENERLEEIREGLAQYTATVVCADSPEDAARDAVAQLAENEKNPTLVRTFAYPLGAAYGILLDQWLPGWPRQIKSTDDLGQMLAKSSRIQPSANAAALAKNYGGVELRAAEEKRESVQKAKVADFRRRFVENPVLILPGAGGSFSSLGVTPIPGAGTVYPNVRVTAAWGSLEAEWALRAPDRGIIALPAPASTKGETLTGDGWKLKIAPGWVVRAGKRAGDFELVQDKHE